MNRFIPKRPLRALRRRSGTAARSVARRGMASVMAMIYLILFSALAVGFYAATSQSSKIVGNEQKIFESQLATESAVDFIRFQLGPNKIQIPPYPHTTDATLADKVYTQLKANLDSTTNLLHVPTSDRVRLIEPATGPKEIHVPYGAGNWIDLDPNRQGQKFKYVIYVEAPKLRVRIVGSRFNSKTDEYLNRYVELKFNKLPHSAKIFDYGVVTRGKLYTAGSSTITGLNDANKGSILSTYTASPVPVEIYGKEVSGDISLVGDGTIQFGSNTKIGGTDNDTEILEKHLHKNVTPPPFPFIDSSEFLSICIDNKGTEDPADDVTRYYDPAVNGSVIENMVLRPGTYKFASNMQIRGVMYIETPCNIEFSGNVDITGVIAVQNNPTGNITQNILDFRGNVSAHSVTELPLEPQFEAIRHKTGTFILAPGFHTKFTGNFGTVAGSIFADKVSMTGNAGGVIHGTILNLGTTQMTVNGSSDIVIASTDTTNVPTGIRFAEFYSPEAGTYKELSRKEVMGH